MEVVNSHYCLWLKNGLFNIENVDSNKILQVKKPQLNWFIESINDLIQGSENRFFLRKMVRMKAVPQDR